MRIGILNATGYSGGELVRYLAGHPEFEIVGATARSQAGRRLHEVFPWMRASGRAAYADLELTPELNGSADLVFSCLPHKASAAQLAPFLDDGVRCIDVSSDFRLRNPADYLRWHGVEHAAPEWIDSGVYGLTEWHRAQIRETGLVANPGCHAITAALALAPAASAGLLAGHVMVDSKTGVSGAGRSSSAAYGFSEINEDSSAYRVADHYQSPEIAQELSDLAGSAIEVTFAPHLVPMTRGILITAYGALVENVAPSQVEQAYRDAYEDEAFIHLAGAPPHTKWTSGGNHAFVHWTVDEATQTLVAMAAIDNLGKGAAGSAVQNANVMAGIDEQVGLALPPNHP
jgi:N-acetyl-gamma-glutamyl-phosphate reductase